MTDNIFERLHSIAPPGPHDELPVVMVDNPSRDFVHPASDDDLLSRLYDLPASDIAGVTHLWLRRPDDDDARLGEFICGSGVRLIVIYAWRSDLTWRLGRRRPSDAYLRRVGQWTDDLRQVNGTWQLHWTPDAAHAFVADELLLHEVGHHLDRYRSRWTPANRRSTEARADSYAALWTRDRNEAETVSARETRTQI